MPKGSFGNLIALPLQGTCRKRRTTVFLDPTTLEAYEDQWAFLSTIPPAGPAAITAIADAVRPLTVGLQGLRRHGYSIDPGWRRSPTDVTRTDSRSPHVFGESAGHNHPAGGDVERL